MHVQQQEGDKKVIDYDDLDNSKAVRNIWGQWGLVFPLTLAKCTEYGHMMAKSQLFAACRYCKVGSSNTSRLGAHAGFIRLLMNGILDPYVL